MKKFLICAAFALLTLASCKKNLSANVIEERPSIVSNAASASNADQVVRIDLTGQQFTSPCTGGTLTVLSGMRQFNIAPDGYSIRSTVDSHVVIQDAAGTIYHGVFVETFEQNGTISKGTVSNTVRFILNPQGG